jgi:hypothetical protein
VNRLSVPRTEPEDLAPIDPERHALEMRIEHAKGRLAEDLGRAEKVLRAVASRTTRGVGRAVLISTVIVAGALLVSLLRLRRRRIRITWR